MGIFRTTDATEKHMKIELKARTAETVTIYFNKAQQDIIKSTLPQKVKTLEEALQDYQNTMLPNATSYGRTIFADEKYVGDIWCYCIDKGETPNAMLSYCIFESSLWKKGIASTAVSMFLRLVKDKYRLKTIGAFTYSDNPASIRVLEKNGFRVVEEFIEDGKLSRYYQYSYDSCNIL